MPSDPATGTAATAPQPATPATAERASVARRIANGTLWALLAFGTLKLLGLGANLVLARLLTPADFGLIAFAMVVIGAFTLLQDLGTSAAIVYGERDVEQVGWTALAINVAAALLLVAVAALAAPALAVLGGDPAISSVVISLSVGLVIAALGSVPNALLMKQLALRRKFLPDVVPVAASGLISVGLAVAGFGVWSLVAGFLTKTTATTALLWQVTQLRLGPGFRWTVAAELLHYGRHVSFAAVIGFVEMNVDYVIIGVFLGPVDLGLYTLAFMIATLPAKAISEVATKVAFPAYAQLRSDKDLMARLLLRLLAIVGACSVPVGVAVLVGAPVYVPVLLGPKWAGLTAPLQVLIVFGVLQSVGYSFPAAYKALGHPNIMWKVNLVKLLLITPLMLLSLPYGVVGIAVIHVLSEALCLPIYTVILRRYLPLPLDRLQRVLGPVLVSGATVTLLTAGAYATPLVAQMSLQPLGAIGLTSLLLIVYAIVLIGSYRPAVALDRAVLVALRRRRSRGDTRPN